MPIRCVVRVIRFLTKLGALAAKAEHCLGRSRVWSHASAMWHRVVEVESRWFFTLCVFEAECKLLALPFQTRTFLVGQSGGCFYYPSSCYSPWLLSRVGYLVLPKEHDHIWCNFALVTHHQVTLNPVQMSWGFSQPLPRQSKDQYGLQHFFTANSKNPPVPLPT